MELSFLRYSIAILLGILAFTLKNIGYTLQKKGVAEVATIPGKHRIRDYFGRKIWVIGIALPFTGALILIVAYWFGPISIVMPFMGTGLVALVLFSRFFLEERIERIEWISVAIIFAGIIVLGSFGGSIDDTTIGLQDAIRRVTDLSGISFLCSPVILCICAVMFAYGGRTMKAGLVLAVSAGIFGGTSLLMLKLMTFGMKDYANTHNADTLTTLAIPVLLFFAFTILAIWLLTQALKKGKAIVIAPAYSAIQMLHPILGGVFIYGEWDRLSPLPIAMESAGILMIGISIVILSVYDEKRLSGREIRKTTEK
jgi:drug/metabolite transporter (DMT)-like permease